MCLSSLAINDNHVKYSYGFNILKEKKKLLWISKHLRPYDKAQIILGNILD